MKFLYDFLPILLFFVAYKVYDIYVATAVAIVASVIQVGWFWIQHRRIEKMHVITLALIIVLGGLTLAFRDETFIKWKPTLVNWAFGLVFLGSQFIGDKPLVKRMMAASISLPNAIWIRLNLAWTLFFIGSGLLNLYVAYNFDTDTWVNFKLFGLLGLTFVFILAQAFYVSRYAREPEAETAVKPEKES